jgi:hypothetical protein
MLMVVEDSNDLSKKMLQIHPNYVENWSYYKYFFIYCMVY